jgi:hypothetical protein
MNTRTLSRTLTLLLAATAAPALAGPLDPPVGPAVSTMKTLAQVEPRIPLVPSTLPGATTLIRITEPGSYYLTGNLVVPADKNGIVIAASNVTIDLSGFTISGLAGSENGIIHDGGLRTNIRIHNGSIANMGYRGIDLATFGVYPPHHTSVERISISNCTDLGMYFNDGVIRDCRVVECGSFGIYGHALHDSVVEGCVSEKNVHIGIRISQGVVRNCAVMGTAGKGIMLGYGTITGCSAVQNEVGIYSEFGLVADCSAQGNTDVGIFTHGGVVRGNSITSHFAVLASAGVSCSGSGARIEGNNISFYSAGIKATAANNLIVGNSFRSCNAAMDTAAGNRVGQLVTGAFSAAIVGNTGGGLGITDPYANIVY